MKAKISAAVALISLVAAVPAFAGDYGQAGCGLGSMLIGSEPGIGQVFAATTNASSYSQTLGITSGTSNCGGSATTASAAEYIETNQQALVKDMAKGGGETLAGLSRVAGCGNTDAVGSVLQENFSAIVPADASSSDFAPKVIDTLKSNAALACGNLI